MIGTSAAIAWIVVSAIFFLLEGLSVQIVSIWFAIGSLFAMIAALVGAPLSIQLLIFLITSVAVLFAGRPFIMAKMKRRKVPTNHDRNIGQIGVVREQIDNVAQTGRVHVDGLDWTARSERGEVIPVDAKVVVRFIDGAKLIVQPLPAPGTQPQVENKEELN